MVALRWSLAIVGWLHAGVSTALAQDGFVAVETGAVLSPRQYYASPALPLDKRQAVCEAGSHACSFLTSHHCQGMGKD
jgi:hypothetical protein